MNGEISVLAVKVMKEEAEADMVDREMEALAAVQGMPHFIQQVDSNYHRHADDSGPALIVTRYAHHLMHLPKHCYFQRWTQTVQLQYVIRFRKRLHA